MMEATPQSTAPFNSPIEVGLRAVSILYHSFPDGYPLDRLVVFDYLVIHSDDIPDGPPGLHPKTPHRSGELLVRRDVLEQGLLLYESRGLVERVFQDSGVYYVATERSAAFLDTLTSAYVLDLRDRAKWAVSTYGGVPQDNLDRFVRDHLGKWGAEFEWGSVLWTEDDV